MLKNYFIVAWRHLTRHKLFSVINIFCLAVGITFSMLIGVYVLKQEKVNADIKNLNDQYIITSKWKVKDMGLSETTIAPLARSLKEN
jgi:putative ABC transport system permease protein